MFLSNYIYGHYGNYPSLTFGSVIATRTWSSEGYRFGFNGKEGDGDDKYYNYGMRIYNPDLAKFISIDPIRRDFPQLSTYQFANNSPIDGVYIDGLEHYYAADGTYLGQSKNGGNELRIATKYTVSDDGNYIISEYKEYTTNSEYTRLGRNEIGKSAIGAKDFNGIHTLSDQEKGTLLAYGLQVFKNAGGALDLAVVMDESVATESNGKYGLLDFKYVTFDLLGLDPNSLLEINGTVYNANEAGNFFWGMVLAYQDLVVPPAIGAEIMTKGRKDEANDQKAIKAGDEYGEELDEFFSKNPVTKITKERLGNSSAINDVEKVKKDAKDGTVSKPNANRKSPNRWTKN